MVLISSFSRMRLLLWMILLSVAGPAAAQAGGGAEVTWRLLDYIAVDYSGAVQDGRVVNRLEYDEMREFSGSVLERIKALPDRPGKPQLLAKSTELRQIIERGAPGRQVAQLARRLARDLLAAYPVPLGPKQPPDLARGAKLFQQNCASCHGAKGDAQTTLARQLDPPPTAFTEASRAKERSPFALYQVINQGIEGTAMQSFAQLPDSDKWALAYRVSRFAYPDALVQQGKRLWNADPALRTIVPDINALSSLSQAQLESQIGPDKAAAVIAYLRADPGEVSDDGSTLGIARQRLRETLATYRAGNRNEAARLALSAYLDGVEPVEPALTARDPKLVAQIERAMGRLRLSIGQNRPVEEVARQVAAINSIIGQIASAIAPDEASAASAFLGAFTIILREGLEALLIVVAMLAFLRKAGRADMTRPVHYGWVGALVAGVLTWWAVTNLIRVSGASRELTEGFGSLLAAGVLLFVGIWMHGKSQADQWQRYIRTKLSRALSRRSAWFLFALAFVAVYREAFETILFFSAMAGEGAYAALLAGAGAGAAALAAIAVAMLRFSRRLPIGTFFAYSSVLIALLAVVLAGKGVAELQEAGLISVLPLDQAPRITMLGLFPTIQTVAAQVVTAAILLAGFAWNRWNSSRVAA